MTIEETPCYKPVFVKPKLCRARRTSWRQSNALGSPKGAFPAARKEQDFLEAFYLKVVYMWVAAGNFANGIQQVTSATDPWVQEERVRGWQLPRSLWSPQHSQAWPCALLFRPLSSERQRGNDFNKSLVLASERRAEQSPPHGRPKGVNDYGRTSGPQGVGCDCVLRETPKG